MIFTREEVVLLLQLATNEEENVYRQGGRQFVSPLRRIAEKMETGPGTDRGWTAMEGLCRQQREEIERLTHQVGRLAERILSVEGALRPSRETFK